MSEDGSFGKKLLSMEEKFGGLTASEVRKLGQPEEENARLRCLVAGLSLDKEMLQEVI